MHFGNYFVKCFYLKSVYLGELMSLYECTFITRGDIPVNEVNALADKFVENFTNMSGKLVKKENWGLRTFAYDIKKNKKGHYIMLGVDATHKAVEEFERQCRINEDIIKYLTIAVDKIEDAPSAMMQAPAKAVPGGNLENDLI